MSLALTASAALIQAADVHEIRQKDKAFSQPEITLKAGEQLRVTNDDPVVHSLFARTAAYEINESQRPGEASLFTFDKPGEVTLRCAIHPKMSLKVTVEEP